MDAEASIIIQHERFTLPIESIYVPPQADKTIAVSDWVKRDLDPGINELRPKYREMTSLVLRRFENRVGGRKLLDRVDKRDIDDFIEYLQSLPNKQGKRLSSTSVNDYMRALKASIRRALKQKLISVDPFEDVKTLRQELHEVVIFQQAELDGLNQVGPSWFQHIFQFALHTAMRREEIVNLKYSDVDFEKRLIYIRNSDEFQPKFEKERKIPLNDVANAILNECRIENEKKELQSDYIFLDEKGGPILGDRASKTLKNFIREAGYSERLNFHALRRTAATRMRQLGVPLHVIQQILGHASLKTTIKYLGVEEGEMEEAMQKLHYHPGLLREG